MKKCFVVWVYVGFAKPERDLSYVIEFDVEHISAADRVLSAMAQAEATSRDMMSVHKDAFVQICALADDDHYRVESSIWFRDGQSITYQEAVAPGRLCEVHEQLRLFE